MAQSGFRVTCLDIVEEALKLAKKTFNGHPAKFVQASILDLSGQPEHDMIWDAGVLEHFTIEEQRQALQEFLNVLKPGGRVVILTPYSRSLPYRMAKFYLEKTGRWLYGIETPIVSLAPSMPENGRLEREYTVSFLPFFLDCYKFCLLYTSPSPRD